MAHDLPPMHNETHARWHAHGEPVLLKRSTHTRDHAEQKIRARETEGGGGKIGARLDERPNSTTVEERLRIRKVGQRGEVVDVLSPLGPARRRFGSLNHQIFLLSIFTSHIFPIYIFIIIYFIKYFYNLFLQYIKFLIYTLLFTIII